MAKPKQLKEASLYFDEPSVETFSTGCALMDCALGGGWARGRVLNVIGDKSTGKTLLGIEGCANYHLAYPKAQIHYAEVEAAFDEPYAEALGFPLDSVTFREDVFTVEDFFEDFDSVVRKKATKAHGALYVLDSLDALTTRVEEARAIDKPTYGGEKAKVMSEVFRRCNQRAARTGVTLMVISQTRDKIGVTFGRSTTRSGGRALDFYASQIVYLAKLGTIYATRKKVKRATGVSIRAKIDKNKISMPHREVDFDIMFGYGIEDVLASLKWMKTIKRYGGAFKNEEEASKVRGRILRMGQEEYQAVAKKVQKAARKLWREIELEFIPKRRKYA